MTSAKRTIAQARKWIGYLEKKSNAQLDDFTANAGDANYTCFGRDYGLNPAQWCGMFVSMVFVYEYGKETAKKLLCGGLHSYTPTGAKYFKNKNQYIKRGQEKPLPGDVIFFYSKAKCRIGHVGIVIDVDDKKVYTIEGNTSGANRLVTNGGGVNQKSYLLTDPAIDGYGRVKYDEEEKNPEGNKVMVEFEVLKRGSKGQEVKTLQYVLLGRGYKLPKYGADGDYGKETEDAVKLFQKNKKLTVDGIAGKKTLDALYTQA